MWIVIVDILGCAFSIFACGIAVVIAMKQHGQILQLTEIEKDTRRITVKIDANNYKENVVKRFFQLGTGNRRFRCLLPVGWSGKPLPSIHAGDYHALHVLQTLLGPEHLDLCFQSSGHEEGCDESEGDAIFLCTPQANRALKRHAHPLKLLPNQPQCETPKFDDIELPCWFAEEIPASQGNERAKQVKVIWICETHGRLGSPAETEYQRCCPDVTHVPEFDVQTDYAIVLRLTVSAARKVFVIAGIHQYGTWIAGEFLKRLAQEDDKWILPHEKNAFLQESDVLAVVWGTFNSRTLTVDNLGVHDNCMWIRRTEGWGKIRPVG